jgi:hypothetical protein
LAAGHSPDFVPRSAHIGHNPLLQASHALRAIGSTQPKPVAASAICKQEVTGSIPVGSTPEAPSGEGSATLADRGMFKITRWHKHVWGEWDRAWGKGNPKAYVLERSCTICGKVQTKVIR